MRHLRRSAERGEVRQGWLHARHSFSFGSYYDPRFMGFRSLRVINEDVFGAGQGFPTHPHRDMEIITYIVEGRLGHKDSSGGQGEIVRGDVQVMTAGRGIAHSEVNPDPDRPVHLLQMWLIPEATGLTPRYDQKHFAEADRTDRLALLVSPDGAEGSLRIHQDARLYGSLLSPHAAVRHDYAPGRHGWLQLIRGSLDADGASLTAGDGLALKDEAALSLRAGADGAEFLLYDLN